ncbi:MAG: hypothetical protein SFX18_05895 [Pirellulales bacterium]|nr:hypothetical protein [Pirellulales bacterium]
MATRWEMMLLAAVLLGQGVGVCLAQAAYDQDALDPAYNMWQRHIINKSPTAGPANSLRIQVDEMLNGVNTQATKEFMEKYVNTILAPHFTQLANVVKPADGNRNLVDSTLLKGMRRDLANSYLKVVAAQGDVDAMARARELFNQALVNRFSQIAINRDAANQIKNYHPLARLNATIILAELNDEMKKIPYPGALQRLYLLASPIKVPNTPPILRITAMNGVIRQAQVNKLPPKGVEAILTDVIAPYLSNPQPPADMATEAVGYDWLRRRALELAVTLESKTPGSIPKLADWAKALVKEETASLELRIEAIEALAAMKELPATVAPDEFAKDIGLVAVAAIKRDLAYLEDLPYPPDTDEALKNELTRLQAALKTLEKKTGQAAAIQSQLQALVKVCETKWFSTKTRDPEYLIKSLREGGVKLDKSITGKDQSDLLPKFVSVPKGTFSPGSTSGGGGGSRGPSPYGRGPIGPRGGR